MNDPVNRCRIAGLTARPGDGERAREATFEAAANARERGSVTDLARAALGEKTMSPMPSVERVAPLEEAVDALRASGSTDRGLLARLLAARGWYVDALVEAGRIREKTLHSHPREAGQIHFSNHAAPEAAHRPESNRIIPCRNHAHRLQSKRNGSV